MWSEITIESGLEAIEIIQAYNPVSDETGEDSMNEHIFGEALEQLKCVCAKYDIPTDLTIDRIKVLLESEF